MPKEQLTPEHVLELFLRSLSGGQAAEFTVGLSTTVAGLLNSATAETAGEVVKEVYSQLKEHVDQPLAQPVTAEVSISPLRRAYRRSAAVLTALDPSRLRPLELKAEVGGAVKELVEDLVEVYEPPSPRERWMLRPEVREEVLREIGGREGLIAALKANAQRPETPVQCAVERLILDEASPPIEELDLVGLTALLQAVHWLQPSGLALPSPEEIQQAIDYNEIPAVFEKMAGSNFMGREKEMELLREYVEVLPPSTALRSVGRQIRRWFGLRSKAPLVIYAPGGAGKTTLVSKFLLDHKRVPNELKFPYIYFDFDNPRLSLRDSNKLLGEAVLQLSAQYPKARTELRSFLNDERVRGQERQTVEAPFEILNTKQAQDEAESAESFSRFAALVHGIVRHEGNEGSYSLPLLLILDTYEEVQGRGFEQEIRLWDLVDSIQRNFETLRTVVCGRAPLEQVPTSGIPTTMVKLEEFDRKAAEGFLRSLGVEDSSVARQLYNRLGGNPLSLKLAAEIYRREGSQSGNLVGSRRSFFFFSASDGLVQGQLYQRILGHVHDPDVRKLAHPGLVLRRVTPGLIRYVLQGPCGVSVPDDIRAGELFEALGREVALVTKELDGSLRHRPDVRRIMLKLLEQDRPEQAKEINRLAVAYYSEREGISARAEEIYHRLQLRAPAAEIEPRWITGVEEFLHGALDELPVESKAFLASHLGIRLKEEDVRAAGAAGWERYIAREAEEMIKLGHYAQALKALRTRRERTKGSPLHLIEARALALNKQYHAAETAVGKALESAAVSGNRGEMLEVLLLAAQLAQERGHPLAADEYLRQAAQTAAALGNQIRQIVVTGRRMLLRASLRSTALLPAPELREELARLVSTLPDEAWGEHKRLLRASVSLLGLDYLYLVMRMVKRAGLGTLDKVQVSVLAKVVTKFLEIPEARELTNDFATIIELPQGLKQPADELLLSLQEFGRLDEYFERLLPIVLKTPGLDLEVSKALARLYLRQPITEKRYDGV